MDDVLLKYPIKNKKQELGRICPHGHKYENQNYSCYYCETCGTFGRSSSRKDHPVIGLMILRSQYKQIIESPLFKGLMRSTEHGTGWYVSKEDFDSILFEVLL